MILLVIGAGAGFQSGARRATWAPSPDGADIARVAAVARLMIATPFASPRGSATVAVTTAPGLSRRSRELGARRVWVLATAGSLMLARERRRLLAHPGSFQYDGAATLKTWTVLRSSASPVWPSRSIERRSLTGEKSL
jgi:hypothetical protein